MAEKPSGENGPGNDADKSFCQVQPQAGLSLEAIGAILAGKLESGAQPYEARPSTDAPEASPAEAADDTCEISPQSILEALLFVGSPLNEPLTSRRVSELMRGVRPTEIDELVVELNRQYAARNCPYRIESAGAGYYMALLEDHARLREQFFGKQRRARLSQAAIEVLATVAYRAPITADEIARLRGKPSRHLLTQLVRRRLLSIDRGTGQPRRVTYSTTPRFLTLFGLKNLDDLPQSLDFEES